MEKNDEVKTIHSQPSGRSKKFIAVVALVVMLLVAGVAYATVTLINMNSKKDDNANKTKPKLVAPTKVMTSIKAANDSAKAAYTAHSNARAAFDEQPVRLVK